MAKKVMNYPGFSLNDAIGFTRRLWQAEHRNRVPRKLVAERLGYKGLSGIALRKIGAMKAYGLLDGSGDAQQISSLAVKILEAPEGSKDRQEARDLAATKPPLFKDIREHFESRPSMENLRYYLINKGFSPSAAIKAAEAYLATMGVDDGGTSGYNEDEDEGDDGLPNIGDFVQWESQGVLQFKEPKRLREISEDGAWGFVEGSNTAAPMDELSVAEAPKGATLPPQPRTRVNEGHKQHPPGTEKLGYRHDVFSSDDGDITISWPASIDSTTFADVKLWLDMMKRKIGRSVAASYSNLRNRTMQEYLERKEAIDVSGCEKNADGDYILPEELQPRAGVTPKDYCDAKEELWIASIGRNKSTGQVLASATGRFCEDSAWECLWLR